MASTAMNPWPISPISPADLDFAVINYDFATFTGNEESELPSIEGVIDNSLLDYAASIADQTTLLVTLFDGLDDLAIIPAEIDFSDDIGTTLSALANSASAADATLNDYNGQIAGSTGGGGTGGNTPTCDVETSTANATLAPGINPVQYTFRNPSNNPVTVTSMTIKGQSGSGWSVQVATPVSVPALSTIPFTVSLDTSSSGTFDAILTVSEAGAANPATFCIHVSVQPAPPALGGGGFKRGVITTGTLGTASKIAPV